MGWGQRSPRTDGPIGQNAGPAISSPWLCPPKFLGGTGRSPGGSRLHKTPQGGQEDGDALSVGAAAIALAAVHHGVAGHVAGGVGGRGAGGREVGGTGPKVGKIPWIVWYLVINF